jgi:DNA-binding Lrp family transcriptional regulator
MTQHKGIVKPILPDINLDATDKKLIALLAHNARFTPSFLGKHLNLSKDGVRYRINKLKKNHILLANIPIINPYALGFRFEALAFSLKTQPVEQEHALAQKLAEHPNTIWVGHNVGTWNLVTFYITNDNKTTEDIKKLCKTKNVMHLPIIAMHVCRNVTKWFLQDAKQETVTPPRLDSSFQKIITKPVMKAGQKDMDELDIRIIRALAPDCTISIADIAKQTKKPFNTIKNRIQQLIKKEILISFNPLINLALINHTVFSAIIQVKDDSETKKLRQFLIQHPNTGYLFELPAGNFAWYAAVKNNVQLHHDIEQLKTTFKSIKDITTMFIMKDYKLTFTPEVIFK